VATCDQRQINVINVMQAQTAAMVAEAQPLDAELDEAATAWHAEASRKLARMDRAGLEVEQLQKYTIAADDDAFAARLNGGVPTGVVQVLLLHLDQILLIRCWQMF
jgi:signal transduction protein with GAF and PtsI domain